MEIVDTLVVPLVTGDFVLGFRWDCEGESAPSENSSMSYLYDSLCAHWEPNHQKAIR